MRIKQITISDYGNIEDLVLVPGAVTAISGRNGTGKSSALGAIASLLEGGHNPAAIRSGAEKATITAELDDGTVIQKIITRKSSKLTVTTEDGREVPSPQTFVNAWLDGLSFSPSRFLGMKPKKRVEALLQALPVQMELEQLRDATSDEFWADSPDFTGDEHPLVMIESCRVWIYEERKFHNRIAKDKTILAGQLKQSLPPREDMDEDWAARVRGLKEEDAAIETCSKRDRANIRDQANIDRGETMEKFRVRMDEARAEYDTQLERLQATKDAIVGQCSIDQGMEMEAMSKREVEDLAAVSEKYSPRQNQLAGQIGEAETKAVEQERVKDAVENVQFVEKKATEASEKAMRLSRALERLERLKLGLLSDLPIKGLSISEDVFLADPAVANGERLPWDRVNKSRQVRVAFEVARLRAGELKVVLIDESECLDSETYQAFLDAAKESDVQLIIARASDAPDLEVSTS